jgi:hypothetical protein
LPRARYFDGATSRVHEVELAVAAGELSLHGAGVARCVPASSVEVSEPGAGGLRILTLAGGGICELVSGSESAALLAQLGHRDSALVRSHESWAIAAACLLLLTAAAGGAYAALPWLSDRIAHALPASLLARVGEETLALLDHSSSRRAGAEARPCHPPALRGARRRRHAAAAFRSSSALAATRRQRLRPAGGDIVLRDARRLADTTTS